MATRDTQQCQTRNSLKALEQHAMQRIINRTHACRIRKKKGVKSCSPNAICIWKQPNVSCFLVQKGKKTAWRTCLYQTCSYQRYEICTHFENPERPSYINTICKKRIYFFLNKFTLTHNHTHLAETQSCKKWAQGKEINLKWRRPWCD